MTIRLLVVDDDVLVRDGLRIILSAEPDLDVVAEAADGEEAIRAVIDSDPDVVLMDLRMPRVDGLEATRRLQARDASRPRVLVVTTFEHDDHVYDALRAGADGFLLKRATAEELVQAVRVVAAGQSVLFPSRVRELVRHVAPRPADAALSARIAALTRREHDVLARIAAGRTNAEIAADLVVSLETVKTHVSSILLKLEARDRTQAVIAAYEGGIAGSREPPG